MKKIIPFNNVLKFNTDVREITAISLEPEIKKYPDMISGVFYISGDYKITDGQLEKEKFNFELPFDIALSNNYDLDTLIVDVDDFRYDLISDKELKVNIDLYIDGEEINLPEQRNIYYEELPEQKDENSTLEEEILSTFDKEPVINKENIEKEPPSLPDKETEDVKVSPERIDLLKEMLTSPKEEEMEENINVSNNNENNNNNILGDTEENYVTYRVYKVEENDTIDSILEKYKITKEMLADYNNIENITKGDKLIIPTNEK